MKLFLSSYEIEKDLEVLTETKPLFVLGSFFYLKKFKKDYLDRYMNYVKTQCKDFILDSGAFSMLSGSKNKESFLEKLDGYVTEYIDYIATSPKFIYGPNIIKLKKANEIRIVVDTSNKKDFINFCIDIKNKIKANKYFLSPVEINGEFKNLALLGEIKQKLKERGAGEWEISIQLHKLMKIQ